MEINIGLEVCIVMYCKDCKYNQKGTCENNTKILEVGGGTYMNDQLRYSYNEGGYFEVGDYFGCVHFREKQCLHG